MLVAPFELIVPEEPLALEKLFPLLGLGAGGRPGVDEQVVIVGVQVVALSPAGMFVALARSAHLVLP